MNKSILFVENTTSFLVTAIINNLAANQFICGQAKYSVDDISEVEHSYDCIFINLNNDSPETTEAVFVYLKDLYLSSHKKVFIMGEAVDIEELKQKISTDMILDTFIRPINARTVTERITHTIEAEKVTEDKKQILVVDDSGSFLHAAKQWLEPTYNVTMLNSATSAIAYLGTHTPDLILLDYEMPVCSGPQMLSMLRSDINLADIPVIFLTGNSDKESITKVLSLKPQGYLLKSLPPEKIVESISNFFDAERRKKLLHSNGYL